MNVHAADTGCTTSEQREVGTTLGRVCSASSVCMAETAVFIQEATVFSMCSCFCLPSRSVPASQAQLANGTCLGCVRQGSGSERRMSSAAPSERSPAPSTAGEAGEDADGAPRDHSAEGTGGDRPAEGADAASEEGGDSVADSGSERDDGEHGEKNEGSSQDDDARQVQNIRTLHEA